MFNDKHVLINKHALLSMNIKHVSLYLYAYVYLYISLCVSLCVSLYVCLFFKIFICFYIFIYFFICFCIFLFVCLFFIQLRQIPLQKQEHILFEYQKANEIWKI